MSFNIDSGYRIAHQNLDGMIINGLQSDNGASRTLI